MHQIRQAVRTRSSAGSAYGLGVTPMAEVKRLQLECHTSSERASTCNWRMTAAGSECMNCWKACFSQVSAVNLYWSDMTARC